MENQVSLIPDIPMNSERIQQLLEQCFYSKVDLSAASIFDFFTVGGGPKISGNIDSSQEINGNSLFACHNMCLNVMRQDGSALQNTDVELIAQLQRKTFLEMKLNNTTTVYSISLSQLFQAPLAVAAAGASAYDPVHIVKASQNFNLPLLIQGAQTLSVEVHNPSVQNLTGLTLEVGLFGIIDRTKIVRR